MRKLNFPVNDVKVLVPSKREHDRLTWSSETRLCPSSVTLTAVPKAESVRFGTWNNSTAIFHPSGILAYLAARSLERSATHLLQMFNWQKQFMLIKQLLTIKWVKWLLLKWYECGQSIVVENEVLCALQVSGVVFVGAESYPVLSVS